MLRTTGLSLCCKRFSKQFDPWFSDKLTKKGIVCVQTISSEATVSLAYDRYEPKNAETPLVVIHGMFGSKRNWNSFCKSYNSMTGREVIAVDCRNHGESEHSPEMSYSLMCSDIVKTLENLDIPKAVVLGHSMGGKIAMNVALSTPSYVEKLIVVDVSPSSTPPKRMLEFGGFIEAMINVDLSQVQSRKDADDFLAKTIPLPDVRGLLLTNLKKDGHGNFIWQLNLKAMLNNLEKLFEEVNLNCREKYEGEALFVAGGNEDSALKTHDLPSIRAMFPRASLNVVSGAGHWVHADKPKEFLNIIHKFLLQ